MTDERLAELKEKYKDRNLLEELAWGIYANHSGYTSKQNGEFLNWLCMMAYEALKERPQGECRTCRHCDPEERNKLKLICAIDDHIIGSFDTGDCPTILKPKQIEVQKNDY